MVEKLRRFFFLILIMVLFVTGAYGNWYFDLENKMGNSRKTAAVEAEAATFQASPSENSDTDNKDAAKKTLVYASGEPVGIYIKTTGVLVLGIQEVETEDNQSISPAKNKLQSGDYILEMNGKKITSKAALISLLRENGEKEVIFTILRSGEEQKVKIRPVYSSEDNCYQIGAWIRNDTQGIGTVTYVTEDGTFAALGHGINDSDLGVKMNIADGSIYETNIAAITKGEADNPGEVIGSIEYIPEKYLGSISQNTSCGVFGVLEHKVSSFQNGDLMEIADKTEIETGEAFIRTSIGGESKDYTIKIEKVSVNKKDTQKALRIEVTDSELIELTGGIIQGLSGSPIIQNGKLVGAVTHVFVDSPTKGYGICAQTMLEEGN